MDEAQKELDAAATEGTGRKVLLLSTGGGPAGQAFARALAHALAAMGHSLALWAGAQAEENAELETETGAQAEPEVNELNGDAESSAGLLALQLEIERAGGISLAAAGAPPEALALFRDAFGRIDAALLWGPDEAALFAPAWSTLDREARPRLLVIAQPTPPTESAAPAAPQTEFPPATPSEAAAWFPPLPGRPPKILKLPLAPHSAAATAAKVCEQIASLKFA